MFACSTRALVSSATAMSLLSHLYILLLVVDNMSGKGVDLTNEILKEILDLLRKNANPDNTQRHHEAPNESDDAPPGADATQEPLIANTEIVKIVNTASAETATKNDWPNDETIAGYRNRCARHKSECEKMQVQLGNFVAHLGIVGGDENTIKCAEILLLHDYVLERENAIGEAVDFFCSLWKNILEFNRYPNHDGALYTSKVSQWSNIAYNGYINTDDLVFGEEFAKCLEFIHDKLFIDLETAMDGVIDAQMTFIEKSATELLATQKIVDFERWCNYYISLVFPQMDAIRETGSWPEPDEIQKFGRRLAEHKILSNEMWVELDHLISHYTIIGGDKAVIEATTSLKQTMLSFVQYLESTVQWQPGYFRTKMSDLIKRLLFAVIRFQDSLYHQKHAFYFRKVKKWVISTWNGAHRILTLLHRRGEESKCIAYIHKTFLSEFERAMIGIAQGDQAKVGENSNAVPEELKTFGKESLPKFLVDQMERDTTRYVNLTTIATFFSSVTATTLQFTYAPLQEEASDFLRGIVNLFWFLSLVFSVSSGVSSLLGLTWRKSSIYDLRRPPWLIHMWFDKAPMLFLIIAAVAFVIGLNLFAYLSLQPRFVSLATNILTGLHGMCLLAVTLWFLYQLKHDSVWAKWIGKVLRWIGDLRVWKWIRKAWQWIKNLQIWIWIRHPRRQYREKKLHLQRNIFLAFGIDNRVARLNYDIVHQDCDRNWPGPYLLSRIIRGIAYPIKKGWLAIKKVVCKLSHSVRKHICIPSRAVDKEGDVELGERITRDNTGAPEEAFLERRVENAKNEFRRSLRKVFSEAYWVDRVMVDVMLWESGFEGSSELGIKQKLWGYPDLVKEFQDRVLPAMIEIRNERNERERCGITKEHDGDNNSVPAPAIVGQEEDITAAIPAQTSQIAYFDDGPGPSDLRKTGVQQDSRTHQDDRPLPPDEHSLLTASTPAEALEPTSRDPDLPLDVLEIGEGSNSSNEIVEVASTSEYDDERSHATKARE